MKRSKWSKREDLLVTQLVAQSGECVDWSLISAQLAELGFNRFPKQIKSRWLNSLVPDINKDKWDMESTERLFDVYIQKGNKWRDIAQDFEGRTDNSIKNQFFSLIRKALRSMAKVIGLDTIVSSTNIVNQIKPKILTDFLRKKIIVRNSKSDKPEVEVYAIDIVKELIFNKTALLNDFSISIRKSVFEIFLKILFEINSDYKTLNKLAKTRFNTVTFNRRADVYVIDVTDSETKEEPNNVLIVDADKDNYKEPLTIGLNDIHCTSLSGKNVMRTIINLKRAFATHKLAENTSCNEIQSFKTRNLELLEVFNSASEVLKTELYNSSINAETIQNVIQFFSKIRLADSKKTRSQQPKSSNSDDSSQYRVLKNSAVPSELRLLQIDRSDSNIALKKRDTMLEEKQNFSRNNAASICIKSIGNKPTNKFQTVSNYNYAHLHHLETLPLNNSPLRLILFRPNNRVITTNLRMTFNAPAPVSLL